MSTSPYTPGATSGPSTGDGQEYERRDGRSPWNPGRSGDAELHERQHAQADEDGEVLPAGVGRRSLVRRDPCLRSSEVLHRCLRA